MDHVDCHFIQHVVVNGCVSLCAEDRSYRELCQGSQEQCQLTENNGIEVRAWVKSTTHTQKVQNTVKSFPMLWSLMELVPKTAIKAAGKWEIMRIMLPLDMMPVYHRWIATAELAGTCLLLSHLGQYRPERSVSPGLLWYISQKTMYEYFMFYVHHLIASVSSLHLPSPPPVQIWRDSSTPVPWGIFVTL